MVWLSAACTIGIPLVIVPMGVTAYKDTRLTIYLFASLMFSGVMILTGCILIILLRRRHFAFGYKLIGDYGIEMDLIWERRKIRWDDIVRYDERKDVLVIRDGTDVREISLVPLFASKPHHQGFTQYVQRQVAERARYQEKFHQEA